MQIIETSQDHVATIMAIAVGCQMSAITSANANDAPNAGVPVTALLLAALSLAMLDRKREPQAVIATFVDLLNKYATQVEDLHRIRELAMSELGVTFIRAN